MSLDDITPEEWNKLNISAVDYEHRMQYNHRLLEQMDALTKQVGGEHYKQHAIQPIEYITANKLGFIEGNIVKYVTRWKDKGGIQDIDKIIHYAELLKKYASVVK